MVQLGQRHRGQAGDVQRLGCSGGDSSIVIIGIDIHVSICVEARQHPLGNADQQLVDIGIIGRRQLMKRQRAIFSLDKDAVGEPCHESAA